MHCSTIWLRAWEKFLNSRRGGGGGRAKGGEGVKQMYVNESLNYSDRCILFYFYFFVEDEGVQEGWHSLKKNVLVDR
jgi:hypothetical protein